MTQKADDGCEIFEMASNLKPTCDDQQSAYETLNLETANFINSLSENDYDVLMIGLKQSEEASFLVGIDDSKDAQLRAQYMPIYTEDRYHGDDAIALKEACLQKFRKVYPNAVVKSLVLPMKTWGSISLTEGDKVVGYQQYLTCYILAQDGTDGYINAEYRFDRQRLVGEAFEKMNGRYPKQTRIDVLPEDVYDKIKH
jgi:hypothetical protein